MTTQTYSVRFIKTQDYKTMIENKVKSTFSEEDMIDFGNWLSKNYNISDGIGWWNSHDSNEDISTKELIQLWRIETERELKLNSILK